MTESSGYGRTSQSMTEVFYNYFKKRGIMNFTDYDSYLFHEGTLYELYKKLGAEPCVENGHEGVRFAVWAPNAESVSLAAQRNGFTADRDFMSRNFDSQGKFTGIWELFIEGMKKGDLYKYVVKGADGISRWKADPMARYSELRPSNASVVWDLDNFSWTDEGWEGAGGASERGEDAGGAGER